MKRGHRNEPMPACCEPKGPSEPESSELPRVPGLGRFGGRLAAENPAEVVPVVAEPVPVRDPAVVVPVDAADALGAVGVPVVSEDKDDLATEGDGDLVLVGEQVRAGEVDLLLMHPSVRREFIKLTEHDRRYMLITVAVIRPSVLLLRTVPEGFGWSGSAWIRPLYSTPLTPVELVPRPGDWPPAPKA